MLKKATVKNFLFCIFVTTAACVVLFNLFPFEYKFHIMAFIVLCCTVNTYLVMFVFKKQFLEENVERENNLKRQIEYSEQHVTAIINNLPLIVYIIDRNYRFITGNLDAVNFFGINDSGYFQRELCDVFEEETMELIREEHEFIIQSKKSITTERVVKLKTGKQAWFNLKKVPILNNNEDVKGFVVFCRNIDFEKNAQRQRETYMSTLSHDLKVPTLAQIRALELLLTENMGSINEEQREILDLTLDSCRCMYDMLSTILTTYKYENNDIALYPERIQLLKLFDDCLSKFAKTVHKKNIKIKVIAKDKFITFHADRLQMQKAFENLIEHCIDEAYEKSEIVCCLKKLNGKINVALSLESPYITSDKIQDVFKMKTYTSSLQNMDRVGANMGLYLAKQIISAHNGLISIESNKMNLNTYNVDLPCINECKYPAIAV